jgi:hypothetical protein
VASTKTMIDRVEQRFAMKPRRLVGDTAYGTASMLGWMVNEKQIAPHVPVWEKTRRDGTPGADKSPTQTYELFETVTLSKHRRG